MKQFYKLNPLQIGSGTIVPDDFIEYTDDNIPSELQEALDAEQVANKLSTKIAEAKAYLASTDWKVIRHRDQLDSNTTPSLANEEYLQLLIDRQLKRDTING